MASKKRQQFKILLIFYEEKERGKEESEESVGREKWRGRHHHASIVSSNFNFSPVLWDLMSSFLPHP